MAPLKIILKKGRLTFTQHIQDFLHKTTFFNLCVLQGHSLCFFYFIFVCKGKLQPPLERSRWSASRQQWVRGGRRR